MDTVDAQEDLCRWLDEECQREMLEVAMGRVRSRVAEHTWSAFDLTELQGIPAMDIAAQLEMNVGTVYVARGRVQKLIVEEVARLDVMDGE